MSLPILQEPRQPYDPSLRITDCETVHQALDLIRCTPNERIPLFRLLFDIIDAEERRLFDPWDLLEMRNVWLQKIYSDPNLIKQQLLTFISQQHQAHVESSQRMAFSTHELELIIECLLKI